uniref:FAD synthase n=2 Tax=Clytia hemisphaerica TaxID=252671 RepID=A0A7M5XGI3_9CNID
MNVHNVFIFPGVPEFMQKSFTVNQYLFSAENKFYLMKIYISVNEDEISAKIKKVDDAFPDVSIGSYPMLNDIYKVKLTLESENQESLNSAFDLLMKELPSQIIVSVKKCEPNSREDHHELINTSKECQQRSRLYSSTQLNSLSVVDMEHYLDTSNTTSLASALKSAYAVFNQTIQMYSLDEICIGFNGGKDCTAVLHLYVAFIKKFYPDNTKRITGLYLKNANPFKEAQDFIKNCEANYNIDMIVIPASIKEGLENLKESHPKIKAVIMGTRRHDPYSSQLKSFTMTDVSWPSYMRVFPILDWSYAEVWDFLRTFDLPYCRLYDEGYTSLGDPKNTLKNQSLLLKDGRYSPAYMLQEESLEREGRNK